MACSASSMQLVSLSGLISNIASSYNSCQFVASMAQRENDRREERGIWAGHSKRIVGPHLTAVLLTDGSQVCIVYDARPEAVRPRISFPPPLPHPSHLPAGPREKFCRTHPHVHHDAGLRRLARPERK